MPRTIICTVGTSIAKDLDALAAAHHAAHPWETDPPDLSAQVEARLQKFPRSGLQAPTDLSTEINSLLLLECGPEDEVILLAADDAIGRICAEHLTKVIPYIFGVSSSLCKMERVHGLHMRDAARFRREGLPNLIQKLLTCLRDPQRRYTRPVVLNPTGGFKGVVPFITVMGMLYGAKVAYVSRASDQLVSLPPLPLTYDPQIFERAREALEWAERKTVFHAEQFFGRISGFQAEELDLFAGFLETDDEDESTLSPLAMVLMEKDREGAGSVLLSPFAKAKLDILKEADRARAITLLRRAANPNWRAKWPHTFHTTDLDVFGGGRLEFRVAGIVKGSDFYVCVFYIADHTLYERDLPKHKKADYDDLTSFEPLPEGELSTDEMEQSWSELFAERDRLKEELAEAVNLQESAAVKARDAAAGSHELREELHITRREARQRIDELEKQISELLATTAADDGGESGQPTSRNS